VLQEGSADTIAAVLVPLNLGDVTVNTTIASQLDERTVPDGIAAEAQTLKVVLAINAFMFVDDWSLLGRLVRTSGRFPGYVRRCHGLWNRVVRRVPLSLDST
jgi:hypothetical protein